MNQLAESEYVVVMEIRVVVENPTALLSAASAVRRPMPPAFPADMKIRAALEALLTPPNVDAIPGVRAPVMTWTARTTARQKRHDDDR
ncbi:MAG: hypothetical protein QOE99_787 [Actinomycetota bacterium]|jgi:hypothetical protein|nr:hypothetical protein [Actinomycetota bacterium]